MKVTVNIDKQLINEAVSLTQEKTIEDALKLVLTEYVTRRKLENLNSKLINRPLEFYRSAKKIRNLNRV